MAQDGPSGGFERDATVSTLPVPDVHPAKREESQGRTNSQNAWGVCTNLGA